jgi:hypothetical protein
MHSLHVVLFAFALVGCRDAKGKQDPPTKATTKVAKAPGDAGPETPQPIETVREKMAPFADDKKDVVKGDQMDSEWTPAEHKSGMSRWKDTGVYVDGKPIGFLTWGELPIALKPTWVKDKVSADMRAGTNDPGWRWARQRFYKFSDYLAAVGIDVKTIKELHLVGPKMSQTLIAKPKDLTGPLMDKFMFRFGTNTGGKPIPAADGAFGNGKVGDKVSGVMVYIKKKPPTLVYNEGLAIDGELQVGVPYFGEPIRGGVRIYLDDKLAGIIKRQELVPTQATKGTDGELHWKLMDVLRAQGIDTKKVVELWVIRDELRKEKLPASALETLTFTASAQAKGGVMLDGKLRANVLALHTREIQPDEIPQVTPDDD